MNCFRNARSLFILVFFALSASCRQAPPALRAPTVTPLPPVSLTLATESLTPNLPTAAPSASTTPSPRLPAATHSASPTPVFLLCSPLAYETIPEIWEIVSDPYNPPAPGSDERHQGVDFSHYSRKERKTIEGEPVQAVLPGRVSAVIVDRLPYGNMVIIETPASGLPDDLKSALAMKEGESLYLLYAHFGHSPLVSLGDAVACGQEIGEVGSTGYNIVNPHLHLEARLGLAGAVFESMAFYTTSATVQEMNNYRRWRTSGEFRHFDPLRLFEYFKNWSSSESP